MWGQNKTKNIYIYTCHGGHSDQTLKNQLPGIGNKAIAAFEHDSPESWAGIGRNRVWTLLHKLKSKRLTY